MAGTRKGPAETRIKNLRVIVAQWNGATNLSKKLGHSGPSYISQLLGGNRPLTEKTARAIEAKLDLPLGWLDREHDGATPHFDRDLFAAVLAAVLETLDDQGSPATPRQISEIANLAYEDAARSGAVNADYIKILVGLIAKE